MSKDLHNPVKDYISNNDINKIDPEFLAYISSLYAVSKISPKTANSIVQELSDQRSKLKLIASENYSSLSTQLAMGNLLTDKYAEGFPYSRFYEGCKNIDDIESYACDQAIKLFGAEHAYIQPHSGADANMVAFWGILEEKVGTPSLQEAGVKNPSKLSHEEWEKIRKKLGNQKLLGLDLASGGHLTHGYRFNFSGKMFDAYSYGVSVKDCLLDYDEIERLAMEIKPLILLGGYSAYPRKINFRRMREIADKCGAVLMIDMAHFAGLVAGKVFTGDYDPVPHSHVVTSTTHKTLRGPRGGIILSTKEYGKQMDKGCPMVLGGPLSHIMAAKAVAFTEANTPEFRVYAAKIVENSSALAQEMSSLGFDIISNGTDNHLFLIDVTPFGITGRQAASALTECNITCNKNAIPFDKLSPMITSGLRIGTPAVTTLGMGKEEMKEIAGIINTILSNTSKGEVETGPNTGKPSKINYKLDSKTAKEARSRIKDLLGRYKLYPNLDLDFLNKFFHIKKA